MHVSMDAQSETAAEFREILRLGSQVDERRPGWARRGVGDGAG